MNNKTKIGLVGGIILLMVLMVWMFSASDNSVGKDGKGRKPYVSSNWSNKFQVYDKKPLGLFLFTSLAQAHIDTSHNVSIAYNWDVLDSLVYRTEDPKTYLFVGNNFGLYTNEFLEILREVGNGSDLFLSYNILTDNLVEELFVESDPLFDYAESINLFAGQKKYSMINLFQNDTISCNWNAFGDIQTVDSSYTTLSSFMEMSNFIRIEHGEGNIYLNTTPAAFYNYQIKRNPGYKYTEFVLNQLPKDQDIILLELGRLTDNYGDADTDDQDGENLKRDDSYLTLIFENPTLLKAMLLSILGIILFVIFRSKRTRPVVPYIGEKKNMTLAFAETITSIYYAKRNPYGLLQVQKKNFYTMVQKHFFIDLNRKDKDNALNSLAEKSNRSRQEIDELVNSYETKEAFSVSDQYVAKVLTKQQDFYRSVGIISEKTSERIKGRELVFRRSLLLPSVFILSGLFLFFFGLYYLVSAIGIGIIFWPVGILLVSLGIIRLSKPYLLIKDKEWTHYSAYGRKKEFKENDITHIEILASGTVISFGENEKLIINYWDLSRFDQKQFKRHISKLHTL
ncbi:MAG: hypothetical protein COA33_006300 [Fluviicola sp.]|nr:hypothetical protein [Fluviicola sp.]